MSAKKVGFSLTLIAALCVVAFSANASALPINVEKFEKAAGTAAEYTSASCTTAGAGGFHQVAFTETAGVEVTNSGTFTFEVTVSGVKFASKCTKLSGSAAEKDAGESIAGTSIGWTFSGCTVTEPAGKGCVVRSSGAEVGNIVFNTLKSTTTATGAEAYKSTYTPAAGELVVTLVTEKCTLSALNGEKMVTGSLSSIRGKDGMKQEFTATSGSALQTGGLSVKITGSFEQKMGEAFVNVGA